MKQLLKRISIVLMLASLVLTGQSCTRGGNPAAQQAFRPITLEYWTVFNSPSDFSDIIADFALSHPNIRVEVKKFRFEEYEETLLNALAEDRGPDIYSIHHTWVPSYRLKLLPMPEVTTLPVQFETGTVQKEVVTEFRSQRTLTPVDLRNQFLDQVFQDVYVPEIVFDENGDQQLAARQIFALPIAFDTMVMYYNRDLLDNAGIAEPAATWSDFQNQVGQIVKFDSQGRILTAAAGIGTANNVPRATDILSLLMMQNGTEMIADGIVAFDETPAELRGARPDPPGIEAMNFYTSFANPNQRFFTWSEANRDAFEAFLQGESAYFFGYSYHKEQIEGLAPRLNLGLAAMPQIAGNPEVNMTNYWVEAVSKKTDAPDAAWRFVQFMSDTEQAAKYLERTNKPTARRDLIDIQKANPEMEVFANQLLTSQFWYQGQDPAAMEQIFKDMITQALRAEEDVDDILELGVQRVQQTLR